MSETADLRSLKLRLSAVERQNKTHRWSLVAGILFLLFVVWIVLPAASATVEAETFVLNDANGTRRAEMSMVLDQPTVTLYDAEGQLQGGFRIGADGLPEQLRTPGEEM